MAVRNKIKEFCNSREITPYRLWKDAGLAPKTAYDLYNNPSQLPSSSVLSKICDKYEIQPSELLEWVKENPENN